MHKFIVVIISIFTCTAFTLNAFAQQKEKIKWMTLEEVQAALVKEKKPVLIDLYTDWCGWCKVMDKKTYTNKNVIAYLQQKFYAVKLNAETTQTIKWLNKSYVFNSTNNTNDFALYLTYGRLSYPTTVIIPTDNSGPQPIPGYQKPKELELIVKYFGDNYYGKIKFEAYEKKFKHTW